MGRCGAPVRKYLYKDRSFRSELEFSIEFYKEYNRLAQIDTRQLAMRRRRPVALKSKDSKSATSFQGHCCNFAYSLILDDTHTLLHSITTQWTCLYDIYI